jgi:hypothetical protein
MRDFFDERGRTRVYNEAYWQYVEEVNPRRTKLIGKRPIYRLKITWRCSAPPPPAAIVPYTISVCHSPFVRL